MLRVKPDEELPHSSVEHIQGQGCHGIAKRKMFPGPPAALWASVINGTIYVASGVGAMLKFARGRSAVCTVSIIAVIAGAAEIAASNRDAAEVIVCLVCLEI